MKEVVAVDINGILIGPNGIKYRIDRFVEESSAVILQAVDTNHVNIIKIPIEELKDYTTERILLQQ